MKLEVGDKVRIRRDLKLWEEFGDVYVNKNMLKHRGAIATIKETISLIGYKIDIDGESYFWTEEMVNPIKSAGKFFKKLPNDYTGTLEVENGYIVENEILDEKEKEYLNAVIRPFRDRIKYIQKIGYDKEYLKISLKDNDGMVFPYFKKGTMYKGVESDKEYTLKELGLDE